VSGRSFQDEQFCFPRVRVAYHEKLGALKTFFDQEKVSFPPAGIFLRVIKSEGLLELWAQPERSEPFVKIRDYKICAFSGGLGPKRHEGDLQVPEGFYTINIFNPSSRFYLSLGLDYPNQADRQLSDPKNPGGEIFIHGNCLSIGCLAMTDNVIKEIYVAAVEAKNMGQESIPVHIFPARLDSNGMEMLQQALLSGSGPYAPMIKDPGGDMEQRKLLSFWHNLREGFERFDRTQRPPEVHVESDGSYSFSIPAPTEEEPQGAPQ
jgi:murein L,D-transpeptidase YafK